jgi:hypothetical protein
MVALERSEDPAAHDRIAVAGFTVTAAYKSTATHD